MFKKEDFFLGGLLATYLDLLEIVGRRVDGRRRLAHVVDVGILLAHLVLVLGASLQELLGELGAVLGFTWWGISPD